MSIADEILNQPWAVTRFSLVDILVTQLVWNWEAQEERLNLNKAADTVGAWAC